MWTYNIDSTSKDRGSWRILVSFINGQSSFTKEYYPPSLDALKVMIKAELDRLAQQDALIIPLGTLPDLIPSTPSKTQAELDAIAWDKNYDKWVKVKTTLIDTGILTGNEAPVIALKTKVQTDFKAAYLDII